MQNKVLKLFITFAVLFSVKGFSQTTEKSEHPLLDKYYPQAKSVDTNKTVTSQINTVPLASPVSKTKPISQTNIAPQANLTSQTIPAPVVSDTTIDIKPVVTVKAVQATVVPRAQPKPAEPLYMDTRLGSSTPQYDTWEKNSNGAGSVTTSPK